MKYRIELVWNREFDWSNYGDGHDELDAAIKDARDILNSGDGARVKKARIVDNETDKVFWVG